jgi:hypothetical protein
MMIRDTDSTKRGEEGRGRRGEERKQNKPKQKDKEGVT